MCLRDKALAKRSVNLFVRELDTAAAPAVRSNALVVLGDLTVRCVDVCGCVRAGAGVSCFSGDE